MTSDAFAYGWGQPGRSKRHHHHHHHGRRGKPDWFFAKERGGFNDIEDLIALRRMWKGAPFGGPGRHRHGRGRARRGDVRLALLRLLAEEPRNGYQLMQAIEELSGGAWRPSPGSVYPTLAQLEDEGLVRAVETDGARRFEITDAGREHLNDRADEPAPWEPTADEAENPLSELAPLVIQIGKAAFQVASVGDQEARDQARSVLTETRRALYRILAEDHETGDDADAEQREV